MIKKILTIFPWDRAGGSGSDDNEADGGLEERHVGSFFDFVQTTVALFIR